MFFMFRLYGSNSDTHNENQWQCQPKILKEKNLLAGRLFETNAQERRIYRIHLIGRKCAF